MDRYRWSDVPQEEVNPSLVRQVIQMPGLRILNLRLKKGAVVPVHHHSDEQVTMLTSGALRFEMDGEELLLEAGEVLRIPSDVPHSVEALEDSTSTELFLPAAMG